MQSLSLFLPKELKIKKGGSEVYELCERLQKFVRKANGEPMTVKALMGMTGGWDMSELRSKTCELEKMDSQWSNIMFWSYRKKKFSNKLK